MRIVQVNYAYDERLSDPGRLLDRYHTLTGWSDALQAAGASVTVVQAFSRSATVRRAGIEYVFCRSGETVRGTRAMHAAVVSAAPHAVHVNGLDAPARTWWLRQMVPARVPVMVQDHAGTPPSPSVTRLARRVLMRSLDGYLFSSPQQAAPWVRAGLVREDRVHAVLEASTAMRPIDRAHAREVTGLAGGPALLWVGRLNHNKDPLTVVNGFARALDALPSAATLSLVFGDGTLLPEVRRRIDADARLAGRVRLVGERPRDELAAWYSAADLFVLGSHHEALGYAALEACACGLTPLITDIAPFRAITGDGAIGLLWTPGDAGACARAIVTASRRDLEQERSAVAAHFDAHLSWRATGARALGIYERVAREARARLRRPIAAW